MKSIFINMCVNRSNQVLISLLTLLLPLIIITQGEAASTPWGASYFPNVALTTHEGEEVHFFDDLIKDKVVVINFIYTACPDSCPLETAQLIRVQNILGARLGQDIFFYSISIDPETDTPQILTQYRNRFGAKWTFLTGKGADITRLRRKLGLYIEEIQDGSFNHNVSMIIGNQATGQWMKRSPFENPYVLADQLGFWLTGWKSPRQVRDYADAPKLRNISAGEQLFRTRCQTCHSITGTEPANALGPDLLGVTNRREQNWLVNWLKAPDKMIKNKDPIALALYNQYNQLTMPNLRLNKGEVIALLTFINEESERVTGTFSDHQSNLSAGDGKASNTSGTGGKVVDVINAWVREALPKSPVNAAYMTLINNSPERLTVVKVDSDVFSKVEVHEMTLEHGLMKMSELKELIVPANGQIQLAPSGKHLMLKTATRHLIQGDKVALTLNFKSGNKQTVLLNVEAR